MLELWETQIHEARLLASMIEIPETITEIQFDSWVNDFHSWDICDGCAVYWVKQPFRFKR